jgi:transcriptional regulator with XRE-family HTH domain
MGEPNFVIMCQQMRVIVMTGGNVSDVIPDSAFWDDYYENLHAAYNSLRDTFKSSGLSQDELAARLGVNKSVISRRLNGSDNLTIKTLSQMGTAMGCRLITTYQPYALSGTCNYFYPTPVHVTEASAPVNTATMTMALSPNTYAGTVGNYESFSGSTTGSLSTNVGIYANPMIGPVATEEAA